MYDKESSILRWKPPSFAQDFRVYRAKRRRAPKGPKAGVFTQRRQRYVPAGTSLSRGHQRYLRPMASVSGSSSLLQEAAEVCAPIVRVLWLRKITLYSEPQPWRVALSASARDLRDSKGRDHHRLTGRLLRDVDQTYQDGKLRSSRNCTILNSALQRSQRLERKLNFRLSKPVCNDRKQLLNSWTARQPPS